jgi:hypothetical protein
MLARCNVPAAASFIISRLSPLVASHAPSVISTLHPSQRPVLHEQLYWLISIVTSMTTDEEGCIPAQIIDASRSAPDPRADPCVAVLNTALPLVEYTMQLQSGGPMGLELCSGSVMEVLSRFLSQFYLTYGCSSDSSIPPNFIAAFGGGGASAITIAALQWCVSSIVAWVCDESVCGACCSCLQSIAAAQSKTRPLDASVLQVQEFFSFSFTLCI